MGISKLGILIKKRGNNSIYYKNKSSLHGKRIGFDTSIFIYKYVLAIRGSNKGKDLYTPNGKFISHIYGIWGKILNNVKDGIEGIWIIDGKPPEIKYDLIEERKKIKTEAKDKIKSGCFKDAEEKASLKKRTYYVKRTHIRDITKLFDLTGIPYIRSMGEAEAQCVALAKAGKITAIASEDWDVLALGGEVLIKDFTGKQPMKWIDFKVLLMELGLTHEEFIELCIILGTDYCSGIGIGPITAYNKYIEYGKNINSFVNHIKSENKYFIPENFLRKAEQIKDYYLNVKVLNPDDPAFDYTWNKPDEEGLRQYLIEELSLNREHTEKNIRILMNAYTKYSQSGVMYGGYIDKIDDLRIKVNSDTIDIDELEEIFGDTGEDYYDNND